MTRVFDSDLMRRHGYVDRTGAPSLRALALAMAVHHSFLYRVRAGTKRPGRAFIQGATRAYPGYAIDFLMPELSHA